MDLVRVGKAAHARHDTEDVVVGRVDTDLGGAGARDGRVREDKLEGGVVNAREIARARRLVLLRAKGERVDVDARVRGAGVRLERLDEVEVGALTLREAVLAVKLELGGDDRVLAPAVHVKSRLGEDEGARIRNSRVNFNVTATELAARGLGVEIGIARSDISGTGVLEETRSVDERSGVLRGRHVTTERHDGVRESVNGVGVIERLGAKGLVEHALLLERGAVVNIRVRLDDPDKLLARVVEVELNLVRRRTDRLIASELELLDEVLVRVLGHAAALVGVKEDVVNVERGSNKRLVVCLANLGGAGTSSRGLEAADSPEALVNRAEVEVNLDLVVLEGDERKRKARVAAVPELERHVESGLREGVARGADLLGGIRVARAVNVGEARVGEVGKLGGIANHLVVTTLLLLGEGELVPDVHPVAVLAVNALATNLNLNGLDKLLSREI